MLSRIDHVALEVPNIDAYISVFTETNGLKLIRKGVATATGRQIAMLGDRLGTKIELIENPECDAIRFLHVAFATNDLACALATSEAAGWLSHEGRPRSLPPRLIAPFSSKITWKFRCLNIRPVAQISPLGKE